MAFTKEALDFLFENRLHDSKIWYQDHKEDYKKYITIPFTDFIDKLKPTLEEIDDRIICEPKRISRIYRDTRFAKDKSLFKQNVWCTLSRPKNVIEMPSFYFDFSPDGVEYGCGYYQADAKSMEAFRSLIIEDDNSFRAALSAYENQDIFELCGQMYKRNRYPGQSEKKCNWLNRKSIFFCCRNLSFEQFFSNELAEVVSENFKKLAPIYHFFIKSEELAAKNRIKVSK